MTTSKLESQAGALYVGELIGYGRVSGDAIVRIKNGLPPGTKFYALPPAAVSVEALEGLVAEMREALIAARDESYIPYHKPWLREKIDGAVAKADELTQLIKERSNG